MEISFVDENDFVKEGKWYLLSEDQNGKYSLHYADVWGNRGLFLSKVKNNLSGIGISQPTP